MWGVCNAGLSQIVLRNFGNNAIGFIMNFAVIHTAAFTIEINPE